MKKVVFSLLSLTMIVMMQSCGETQMDLATVQAKVDSMAASKIEAMNATATSECETRMATEVKSMADSIVHAAQMANAAQ